MKITDIAEDDKPEEMKLFNIKPNEVLYTVIIHTFKYNKVFNKILEQLKKNKRYKIRELNKWEGKLKEYEIVGVLAGTLSEFVEVLKSDIVDIIPTNFPVNYSFEFSKFNPSKICTSLGYTSSFTIFEDKKTMHVVSHRITEVRKESAGELPAQIIKY